MEQRPQYGKCKPPRMGQGQTVFDLDLGARQQLTYVLTALSVEQLVQIAEKVLLVSQNPGIGRVYITIENHHPLLVGVDWADKLVKCPFE